MFFIRRTLGCWCTPTPPPPPLPYLEVWLDGGQIFTATDSELPYGTIGFYTWGNVNSYFDDLSVQ